MNRKIRVLTQALVAAGFAFAGVLGAQQLIVKGEYGMMAGVTPPPGFYGGMWGSIDWASELKTANGDSIDGP